MGQNKFKAVHPKSGRHFRSDDIEPRIDYDSYKPAFSFRYMHYGSTTCLSKCDKQTKSSISDTLLRLSQLAWNKIIFEPKKGLGFETIPYEQFKNPLPSSITPDVKLIVFRFSGSGRMAGFRSKDIYHIVQISAHHNLY